MHTRLSKFVTIRFVYFFTKCSVWTSISFALYAIGVITNTFTLYVVSMIPSRSERLQKCGVVQSAHSGLHLPEMIPLLFTLWLLALLHVS